jgi:GDP-4-dehydro-6-deoxy-D-mannose reductase
MRVFVTGADGFVGRHLGRVLRDAGHAVSEARPPADAHGFELTDPSRVRAALEAAGPEAIVHLAAVSSVAESHRDPARAMAVNALGATHLVTAAKDVCPRARLLFVSSGEVYGRPPEGRGAVEDLPLAPLSPYAASKVAGEVVALQFHRSYGLDVVVVRPFSHIGRGQAAHFVVPSFASRIATIARGEAEPVLRTGDLSPRRDLLHVEDVARAYELLLGAGEAGGVYNVASGTTRTIRQLLDEMLALARVEARIEPDPALVRPIEIPELIGDATRLRALGWAPRRTVRAALVEVFDERGLSIVG